MTDSLEYLDLGNTDTAVIALAVHGKISGEDMADLVRRLEEIHARGQKARLYLNLVDYDGYDLAVVKEKLLHMRTLWSGIERCAYVVDQAWMTTIIGLVDAVTPMHLRAFSANEDEAARAWVVSNER
jgi:hypothetical protein